jgi:hypothetical protein
MKKSILCLALTVTALLLGGCLPEEFIWWSPDGQTAAVRTSDGLRLAGTNGQLSEVVLPGEIQSAAWLPDGSGVVVSRSSSVKDWAAAEKLIPPEEAAAAMQLARAIPDLLQAALVASGGSWDDLDAKFLKPLGMTESHALEPAWSCALSLHREQILAVIAGYTNAATLESKILSSETNGIPVHEITILSLRHGQPAGESRALIRSLRPLIDPALSPHHPILAFRTDEGALKAMTLDGKSSLVVAGEDVPSMAWSADGCALMYVVMGKNEKVGEICSRTVVGGSGELLQAAPQAETLAVAAFVAGASPRLRVLPDGHLLFASVPITLPARTASLQPAAQFFLLDPARPDAAPVAVIVKEGSLPDDLSAFASSPDGRFVAVVEGGTDVVAVLELATGQVKIISPLHAGWKSRMVPAWRNQRELTFAALPSTNAARPEVILWQADAPERILSKSWPDQVVSAWLEAPRKNADQPAK